VDSGGSLFGARAPSVPVVVVLEMKPAVDVGRFVSFGATGAVVAVADPELVVTGFVLARVDVVVVEGMPTAVPVVVVLEMKPAVDVGRLVSFGATGAVVVVLGSSVFWAVAR
jgi:hypothetical protein